MTDLLSISTFPVPNGITIAPRGEIDLSSSDQLRTALHGAQRGEEVTLDLSAVSFIDSTGLRVLLEADNAARSNGHEFRVANPSRRVQRTLEIAGLLERFGLEDGAGRNALSAA